jgi:hypothetical protein
MKKKKSNRPDLRLNDQTQRMEGKKKKKINFSGGMNHRHSGLQETGIL